MEVAIVVYYIFSSTEFGFIWEGADGDQSETGKSLSLKDKKKTLGDAGQWRWECPSQNALEGLTLREAKLHHRKEEKKSSCSFVWRTAILCAMHLQSWKMVRTAPEISI